jgi:ribosome-associated protein
MPSAEDLASGPLRVTASIVIPAHELAWRFSRSSGPGGQGVNTTDSRVERCRRSSRRVRWPGSAAG